MQQGDEKVGRFENCLYIATDLWSYEICTIPHRKLLFLNRKK